MRLLYTSWGVIMPDPTPQIVLTCMQLGGSQEGDTLPIGGELLSTYTYIVHLRKVQVWSYEYLNILII